MDIAVEKMTVAEKLLAMERLWNSLQAEETFTPPDWHEQVLSERLQALRDGQVQFSTLEEVAERLQPSRIWQRGKISILAGVGRSVSIFLNLSWLSCLRSA
jgi:putative addiction module component (TIGR02574 family)